MRRISFFVIFLMACTFVSAQTVQHIYHFSDPKIETRNGYEQISFGDCRQAGEIGQPSLPWQSISLLLPMNQEAQSISIELSDFVELEGNHLLYPYQAPRPLSDTTPEKFIKDVEMYRSESVYPQRYQSDVTTQYMNGCSFAFSGFTPVQYIPATGTLRYAQTVVVSIETESSRENRDLMLWLKPENKQRVLSLAQNPEALDGYKSSSRTIGGYDLLIVTPQEWVDGFGEYINYNNARGIRTRIATTEDIYATMQGLDNADKIRNYIIQEYQNNGILMVNLGGDVALVPFRGLYCYVSDEYIDVAIPSDLYFAGLDGNWNNDGDEYWGEIGEDDLLPEIGVGRMPFNNAEQFQNVMHKTMSYQTNPVLGEFRKPTMGAEMLNDEYCGKWDLELLIGEQNSDGYYTKGIPEDYDFVKLYADEGNWSAKNLKNAINAGTQYVHHVGHANTDYVAGWYNSTISDSYFAGANGVDHNYIFFHSHGCICGDFSHACIMEKMVTLQTCAVVTIGNSRYGWYQSWGDGPARHLHREFTDAYYNDRIPFVGLAMVECKTQTAPNITAWGEDPYLRWNFYDINVIGDPAACPWLDEPFNPDVNFETGLLVGSTSTEVNVSEDGTALSNFRCSLYNGDELLAFGMTDEEGNVILNFNPALNVIGEMQLIVTGPNAWPQTFTVKGVDANQAFVMVQDIELNDNGNGNDIAEYGESFTIDMNFHNIGNITANNVNATLSCESEYINITNANANIGNIQANSSINLSNAFAFTISDVIPDFSKVYFTVTSTDGTNTWTHTFSLRIMAPKLEFLTFAIDDSQGNGDGLIDQGEHIVLHITGQNNGHASAPNSAITANCSSSQISIDNPSNNLGNLAIGATFNTDIEFNCSDDIIGGSIFDLDLSANTGNYASTNIYTFSVGHATETFESGDFSFMDWEMNGDLDWTITDELSHSGTYCAQSGAIDDDQISGLVINLDIFLEGELSFYFKTSTEKRDYLIFYLDGKVMDFWSEETDWTRATYNMTVGSHVLEWRYDKSPKDTEAADRVWVDDISFPSACIITNVDSYTQEKTSALYPNPNNGNFTLYLTGGNSTVTIFNQLGQQVYRNENLSNRVDFSLENLPAGIYFTNIQSSDNIQTIKFVVK